LFSPAALALIADRSEGIPRNINNICFHALSVGFARRKKTVDSSVMNEVLWDLNLERLKSRRSSSRRSAAAGAARQGIKAPRETRRPRENAAIYYLDHGSQRESSTFPPPASRERLGGRLFWAAALVTLVIWAGVFWNSATLRTVRDGAGQIIAEIAPRVEGAGRDIHGASKQAAPHQGSSQNPKNNATEPETGSPAALNTSDDTALLEFNTPMPAVPDTAVPVKSSTSPEEQDAGSQSLRAQWDANTHPHSERTEASARKSERAPSVRYSPPPPALPATGDVVVESDVPGGRITVNGKNESGWVTPHILHLQPGEYRIAVSKGGYSRWIQVVQVQRGVKRWVMASLGQPSGLLMLKTDPPGLVVYIDGKYYGRGEVQTTLKAGEHTYKVFPPSGKAPFEGKFELEAGRVLMKSIHWQDNSNLGENLRGIGGNNPTHTARRTES
jgi:PEGA domain